MDLEVTTAGTHRVLRQPGFDTGWRSLPWLTVQAVLQGAYRIEYAAGTEPLPAGALWFVPLGCRHRHAVSGREPAETIWWHGEVRLHGACDAFAACGAPCVLPGGMSGPIGQALMAVWQAPPGDDLASVLARQGRATLLAAGLAAAIGGLSEASRTAALVPVFRFIDANLHLPLRRAELAARIGLAPSRFHELFLAATGRSPMAWVVQRRLAQAATLLVGTSLGMAEIAARVGLCDAYHLNKRFRAAYGMPPTAFRRQAQG